MTYKGINFRLSASNPNGRSDSADDTYFAVTPDGAYSISRGGLTFGITGGDEDGRDRDGGNAKLDGMMFAPWNAVSFRVDLTDGAGTYNIRIAVGDIDSGSISPAVQIRDGTSGSALLTISGSLTSAQFLDATNTVRTSASDWLSNNAPTQLTFTSSYATIYLPDGGSRIAHFAMEFVPSTFTPRRTLLGVG